MNSQTLSNVRTLRRPSGSSDSAIRRLRANWPAESRSQGKRIPCMVTDISSEGACLSFDRGTDQESTMWLIIDKMPISAEIVWRKKNEVGVRFEEEQEWILDACKKRFDPTAWLQA